MTIFFYIAINLMMVMGLAPVVGIPLPLFSYGGSSMMTVAALIGIVLAIAPAERHAALPLRKIFAKKTSAPLPSP